MAFIQAINIKSFRGIRNLSIQNLSAINLIVGDNNCGKTSALEAIELLRTSGNLANLYRVARQRESMTIFGSNSVYDSFLCMFPHDGSELKIEVEGICNSEKILCQISGKQERVLLDAKELDRAVLRQNEGLSGELETDVFNGDIVSMFGNETRQESISINRYSRVSGTPSSVKDKFNIVYVAPFEHLRGNVLSQIVRNESYKNICLKALQLFDQNIENLMILRSDVGNRPVEYIKHRKLGNMPLATYGDGIKKVLVLANAIAGAASGVLLIDEIETAIHKKYYDDIFRFVIKACKAFNVQVFITTHSLEAIDGILATSDYDAQDEEDDIKVVTLKRENDSTFSRVLPGREVFTNREAFGFEVRL
jgi:hypothetical protein